MPYTADNIQIQIYDNTAILATDYGTSGAAGFSLAHVQHAKIAWGDIDNTYRTTESTPLPVKVYGSTAGSVSVSGTIAGTGDFYVRTNPTIPLIIKGSTFTTDAPVGVTGTIQGIANGTPVGVTGYVNILNQVAVFGVSGATAIAVTGGRRLNSATDSVSVSGYVGISGGFELDAMADSVSVYGPAGSTWHNVRLWSSNTAIGASGDALKVAVTNAGFTFSVSIGASVGVTNSGGPLRVQGDTAGTPVIVKGNVDGALEVVAYDTLPVGITGTISIDDTDIISAIDGLKTNIGTVASNAGYALDILNLINSAGNGAKVVVASITKPSRIVHGQKALTTTPILISSDAIKTGVTIKSVATNTVDIYVGNTIGVTPTTGYVLSPGESVYLEVSSVSTLFARSASGTATLTYIGS